MSVERYSTKSGDMWMVRYRDPAHQPKKQRGFATKRQALDWERTTILAMRNRTYIDPHAGRQTVGELAPRFFDIHTAAPGTMARYRSAWRVRVEAYWSTWAVDAIRKSDVLAWIKAMEREGRTPSTIGSALDVLSGVLGVAVMDGLIPSNVVPEITRPARQRKRRNYLTHAMVDAIAQEAGRTFAPYGLVVSVLAYTGVRFGELSAWRVRDFDREHRRLIVRDGATEVEGRRVVGNTKTKKPRAVSVPDFLADRLAEQARGKLPDAWLFVGPMGSPLSVQRFRSRAWRGALDRARRADPMIPHVTPNDLRHAYASLSVQAGGNVKTLQRGMGHDRGTTTLDAYADLLDADLDDLAARMSAARADAVERAR